jgi:hypothetical protein
VTPYGEIVALPGRGTFMGNRGVLHDDHRRIIRAWQVRRWIACVLEFRDRKRAVMTPRRYTELFFLDEAAAFAAGHRPCAECRRADYERFRTLWESCRDHPGSADVMDLRLHAERLDGKKKRTYRTDVAKLPDGAYVVFAGAATLVLGAQLYAWSDSGYVRKRARPRHGEMEVLTPPSIVAVLGAGYRPAIHPSVRA